MTVISFIQSMSDICRPFLIVTASSSLSQWEAEFARLAPSVDVVVFSGNRDTRKGIRASEFYEGGHVMLQVLLSSAEAVFEVWIAQQLCCLYIGVFVTWLTNNISSDWIHFTTLLMFSHLICCQ